MRTLSRLPFGAGLASVKKKLNELVDQANRMRLLDSPDNTVRKNETAGGIQLSTDPNSFPKTLTTTTDPDPGGGEIPTDIYHSWQVIKVDATHVRVGGGQVCGGINWILDGTFTVTEDCTICLEPTGWPANDALFPSGVDFTILPGFPTSTGVQRAIARVGFTDGAVDADKIEQLEFRNLIIRNATRDTASAPDRVLWE